MIGDSFLALSLLKNPHGSLGPINIPRLLGTPESLRLYLSLAKVALFMILFYSWTSFTFLKDLSILRKPPMNFSFYPLSEVGYYKYSMAVHVAKTLPSRTAPLPLWLRVWCTRGR